jgi:hypothetical protein
MSDDHHDEHTANLHRVLGVPLPAAPEIPKVVDIRTRQVFHPPGSLGAVVKNITDAFKPRPKDG